MLFNYHGWPLLTIIVAPQFLASWSFSRYRMPMVVVIELALLQLKSLLVLLPYLLFFALFQSTALGLSRWLQKHRPNLTQLQSYGAALGLMGLLAYLAFGLYLLNARAGLVLSALIFLFSLSQYRQLRTLPDYLKLSLWMGIFFIALSHLNFSLQGSELHIVRQLFGLSLDSELPMRFADTLRMGKDIREPVGGWLSSDRPPLQTALYLLFSLFKSTTYYQAFGLMLQLLWIPALWLFSESFVLAPKAKWILILFSLGSGFFYVHSVFVWPKLLAASFALIAFAFFRQALQSTSSALLYLLLAALSWGLAILSHSGVIFSAPTWVVLYFFYAPRRHLWSDFYVYLKAGLLLLALGLPWIAYQKFYDPPGNRLLKMHLAGVENIDTRSLGEAVRDRYSGMSWQDFLHDRAQNIKMIMGPVPTSGEASILRGEEFFPTTRALGVLLIGLLALAMSAFKKTRASAVSPAIPSATSVSALAWSAVLSLIFWSLLLLGSGTSVHQGSFATMLLLFILGSVGFLNIPRKGQRIFLALQWGLFVYLWVLNTGGQESLWNLRNPNYFAALLGVAALYLILREPCMKRYSHLKTSL